MGNDERLTARQFQASGGVDDWRVLAFGTSAWFDAPSHAAGAALVRRIVELPGTGRLPDVDVRAGGVHVRLPGHDGPGLTRADLELARAISAAARDLGLTADPSAPQAVLLTFDALDKAAVMPFWHTVLGYERLGDDDLVDAMRRDPGIWFQLQDQPRPLRNRIHLDVSRQHPPALDELQAVGGRQAYAGDYYGTFADAEGNEADIIPATPGEELGEGPRTADWRIMFGAMTFYPTASPAQAAELAAVVAGLADAAGLPLLIDLRPEGVTIDTGKDQWEDSPRFPALAGRIQSAARELGLTADPSRLRFVQLGIDAVDIPAVRAFWRAVLGYEYDPRSDDGVTDIFDPRRLNPPIFFQQLTVSPETEDVEGADEARRKQRNRVHIDVFVPDDQAQSRISSALAAGGRVVDDAGAPAWVTLADQEGNEVDIAVSVGREECEEREEGA